MTEVTLPRTLAEWLSRCESAHHGVQDRSLNRLRAIRDRLDIRFRVPVITVAGTNGKGSTCAMLESIARHAGLRVGLYTKPHLLRFEERCRVDGEMVTADQLVPHFQAVELARGGAALTWFEHTTLAILSLLSRAEVDLVILEVGLGGRLDAVNVIDADCAVITGVDLDHTETLGPDREAIGREKAGIFRSGRIAVVGDPDAPMSVVAHAKALGVSLYLANRDFFAGITSADGWQWSSSRRRRDCLPRPSLAGHGQILNASTALAVFEALTIAVADEAVSAGLRAVALPGRCQVIEGSPEIVLDVAHNPQAVRELVETLRGLPARRSTHLVFGCMTDKDIPGIIAAFSAMPVHWHACDLPGARAARAIDLAAQVAQLAPASCTVHETPVGALAAASAAGPEGRIVVFGSFLTVAAVSRSLA